MTEQEQRKLERISDKKLKDFNTSVEFNTYVLNKLIHRTNPKTAILIFKRYFKKEQITRFLVNTKIDFSNAIDTLNPLKKLSDGAKIIKFYTESYRCKTCGKVCLRDYCSNSCAQLSPETQNKIKKTCLEKYGVESSNQSQEVKEKIKNSVRERYGVDCITQSEYFREKTKQTCLEKYDVENVLLSDEFKEKIKQTNLEKYGVENPVQNEEIKNKIKSTWKDPKTLKIRNQTCLERYGTENPSELQKFKDKSKHTCLERYGVEYVSQSQEIKDKVIKTNLEKYGTKVPSQSQEVKDKMIATCLEKYNSEWATQSQEIKDITKKTCNDKFGSDFYFTSDAYKNKCLEKYGVDNYSKVQEIQNKSKITYLKNNKDYSNYDSFGDFYKVYQEHANNLNKEYCLEHFVNENNKFDFKAFIDYFFIKEAWGYHIKEKLGIDTPNFNTTGISKAEQELFDWIPTKNKIQSDRTILRPLELDIYLPDNNLAIEYDGVYWHCDFYKDRNYHLNKTKDCLSKGIQLFHIFENDDIEIWKSMISNKLGLNKKIYARKCTIKELKYSEVKDFLDENHLQGACVSKINLGLFYEDNLVEVMTFSKPRFNQNYDYELIRLCSLKFTNVVGGASKLFKYFRNKYKGSVISYANRRFSNGNIYRNLGFSELKSSEPNYFYFREDHYYSRNQCQKHKLKDLLEFFDPNLSEYENMCANDYLRIFDCGNLVFEII